MLVMSRGVGQSAVVTAPGEECVVTVIGLPAGGTAARALIVRAAAAAPGRLDYRAVDLRPGVTFKVGDRATVELVALAGSNLRLGFHAGPGAEVHRLEVVDGMRRERPKGDGGASPGGGPAGSPVPRTPRPAPPSLSARLPVPQPLTWQAPPPPRFS